MQTKWSTTGKKLNAASVALMMFTALNGATLTQAQSSPAAQSTDKETAATQNKFNCNLKALNPDERTHQTQLSHKLMAARTAIVESQKGYEFQFSPANVSLSELTDWVAAESKCCPFFDFHVDLENKGTLLCLRLTGEEGIKQFIRAEFQLPAK